MATESVQEVKQKTYKREVASVLLAVVIGLVLAGLKYPEAAMAAESLKFEVFSFAALAFGMDAWSKQIRK